MPDRFCVKGISCEALSITLPVVSSELGGAGGKRILNPNKCFFFLISFPDLKLEGAYKKIIKKGVMEKTKGYFRPSKLTIIK